MSDTQITKVYELKTIGGQDTYNQLERINTMFREMAKNKASLGTINITTNIDGSAFDKLNAGNKELVAGMKQLTATMKEVAVVGQSMVDALRAAFGKMNMASMENIVGFTKFQGTMNASALTAERYAEMMAQLRLKSSQLNLSIKDNMEAIIGLRNQFNQGAISQEEYNAAAQQIQVSQLELKAALNATGKEISSLTTLWNISAVSAQESNAQAAANRLGTQQQTQLLKLQAQAELSTANSINEARAQSALYRKELNDLNLSTEEGVARQKELIATIAEYDAFIKNNADLYTRQKINIGNYPTLTSEFAALRGEMQRMILAGEQGSAEFAKLQARAEALSAQIKELNVATGQTANFAEKTATMIERMGIRMLANMLIFQTAIELGQYLWEQWTKLSDAEQDAADHLKNYEDAVKDLRESINTLNVDIAVGIDTETNKADRLVKVMNDGNTTMMGKINTYKELQGLYPSILGALSEEEAKTFDLTDKHKQQIATLTEYIKLKVKMNEVDARINAAYKVKENASQQMDDLSQKFSPETARAINRVIAAQGDRATHPELVDPAEGVDESAANKYLDYRDKVRAIEKSIALFKQVQLQYAVSQANLETNPYKKEKQPKELHDYTNAELEAQKKLNDEIAKLLQNRLTLEMDEQKEVFENTQNSLNQRLSAYAIYARDLKQIIQLQTDAEIKDVQNKLDKIGAIEQAVSDKSAGNSYNKLFFDKSGNLRPEEQTLLLNKDALSKQLDVIVSGNALKTKQAEATINKDIASITSSSANKMLSDIEADISKMIAELEDKANAARAKIYSSGSSLKRQDKAAGKVGDQESVSKDLANIEGNRKEQEALQHMIDQEKRQAEHNSNMEQLEAQHLQKLQDLKNKAKGLQTQLQTDQHKQLEDNEADSKKLNDTIRDQSINAFQQIGDAYIKMLADQSAIMEKRAQQSLDWNKKESEANVQSLQQKQALDKADYLAQQQLDKQRLQDQRKLAESQMAIDYATAVMKIVAANAEDFEVLGAVEIGAITAVYAAKLAMMNSVQYGAGGDVPSSGGQFGGRSHSSGGTPFVFQNNSFEAEADELAIINKRSATSNDRLNVSGTPKQIASAINSYGGGTSFAPGAKMYRFDWGGSLGANITPPAFISDHYTTKATGQMQMQDVYNMVVMNNQTLNKHAEVLANHAQALQHEAYKPVVLNPNHVTDYQDKNQKSVRIGTLG